MTRRITIFPFALIAAAALLASCERAPQGIAPPETRAERQLAIDRIAAECQVPRVMMILVGEDRLRLQPPPELAYERLECVLRRIDQLDLPPGNVDFPGDQARAPEANNAAPH